MNIKRKTWNVRNRFGTKFIMDTSEEWKEVRGVTELGMEVSVCRRKG